MKIPLLLTALFLPLPAGAINLVFTDVTPSGGYPSFDPGGSKLAAIVAACEATWQDIIEDSGAVTIEYQYRDIDALASATATTVAGGIVEVAGVQYLSITARINTLCVGTQGTLAAARASALTGFSTANITLHSNALDEITRIRTMTWRSNLPFGSAGREQMPLDAVISP